MLPYVGLSSEEEAMPFGNPQSVIDGIHECLGDNQGRITVECTKTGSGEDAMYGIVKTVEPFDGEQYCLNIDIGSRNGVSVFRASLRKPAQGGARRRRDGDGGKRRNS